MKDSFFKMEFDLMKELRCLNRNGIEDFRHRILFYVGPTAYLINGWNIRGKSLGEITGVNVVDGVPGRNYPRGLGYQDTVLSNKRKNKRDQEQRKLRLIWTPRLVGLKRSHRHTRTRPCKVQQIPRDQKSNPIIM